MNRPAKSGVDADRLARHRHCDRQGRRHGDRHGRRQGDRAWLVLVNTNPVRYQCLSGSLTIAVAVDEIVDSAGSVQRRTRPGFPRPPGFPQAARVFAKARRAAGRGTPAQCGFHEGCADFKDRAPGLSAFPRWLLKPSIIEAGPGQVPWAYTGCSCFEECWEVVDGVPSGFLVGVDPGWGDEFGDAVGGPDDCPFTSVDGCVMETA